MTRIQAHRRKLVPFFSAFILTISGAPLVAQAQPSANSNASPPSSQTQTVDPLAERQKELAELRLRNSIREEESKFIRNSLPKAFEARLEGKTTIPTSATFESKVLAHQALQKTAEALGKELKKVSGLSSIVVYEDDAFKHFVSYQRYLYLYESLKLAYESESGKEPVKESISNLTALEIPTRIFGSVADFLSLFRTDKTINDFAIGSGEKEALVAQLARQFSLDTSRSVKLFYPEKYSQSAAIILTQFKQLLAIKKEAQKAPSDIAKAARLQELETKFKELIALVSDTDTLAALANGANTSQILAEENSYILFFTLEQGGSNLTTRNLFFGSRTRHSGGAIVNYILFNPQGEIVTSNTLYYHTGYVHVRANEPITNIQR